MPERSAAQIYGLFQRRVNGLRRSRDAAENARRSVVLDEKGVDLLYEVTFLNVVAGFEALQDALFYSALMAKSKISGVEPIVPFKSRAEAQKFVLAGERTTVLSWTKAKETIERAGRYLRGGRPFSRLQRRDKDIQLLKTAFTIRNAIAHQSGPAREEFGKLRSQTSRAVALSRPGRYLRQAVGSVTQHETLCLDLLRIATAISASSTTVSRRHLHAERPFRTGERVARGRFRCTKCSQMTSVMASRTLPLCSSCSNSRCSACGRETPSTFDRLS